MTTTRGSSGFRIWRDRIEGGVVTHAQACQFSQRIYPLSDDANAFRLGHKSTITPHEATLLVGLVQGSGGLGVDARDAARGLAWLRKARGLPLTPALLDDSAARFTWVGTWDYYNEREWWRGRPVYRACYPIYRFGNDRSWFLYAPYPWQTRLDGRTPTRMMWQYRIAGQLVDCGDPDGACGWMAATATGVPT